VFGQHIHIGCASADDALYLNHAVTRYVPHLIALAASSPFYQGVDTAFDSSRLSVVNAFPLSGTMPFLHTWEAFNAYFDKMRGYGIVESMKDFYWDVRPKPEYGTVEIRVCDTPLTVDRAAQLAGFAQALARWLWDERPALSPDMYLVHSYNRFQACRHGLAGTLVDPVNGATVTLADDLRATLARLMPHAQALGCEHALEALQTALGGDGNDAAWLRARYAQSGTLPDVVRQQAARFMG
jgi:carboxylate-amine ligase